jgi:iron complex outermembrane recepter protein
MSVRFSTEPTPVPLVLALRCAWAGLALLPAWSAAQQVPAPSADAALPTVTVIGEKMGRSEKDTITGTKVFDAQELSEKTEKSLIDLIQEVPNVTIGGFGGFANIRGVDGNGAGKSSLAYRGATRSRTATIVDGVSQIWTGGNVMNTGLWDVEQVEVLRGPQSTAQGRSAAGGAVVMKTRDPSFQPEAAIRLGSQVANGKWLHEGAGVVSGPLGSDWAYRLSAQVIGGESFVDYVDDSASYDYNRDPDDIRRNDLKAKLLWAPQSNRDLLARFDLQHQSQKGAYMYQVDLGDRGDYKAPMSRVNHRIGDTTLDSAVANVSYALTNTSSLDTTLALSRFDSGFYHNQSASSFKMDTWKHDSTSLESRYNIKRSSGLRGMLGLSIVEDDQDLFADRIATGAIVYDGTTKSSTRSLFGELELPLAPRWALIAGGRIEHESQDRTMSSATTSADSSISDTYVLPKVALRYAQDKQTTLGVDLRRGYTPGGLGMDVNFTNIYEYDAEFVTALEFSYKTVFAQHRGHFNVSVFQNRFQDYQSPLGSNITNVDRATIRGLEVESSYRLSPSTEAQLGLGLLSSKVKRFASSPSFEGNHLPFAANKTVSAGVQHQFNDLLRLGLTVKYVGSYYVDIDNHVGDSNGTSKAGNYAIANLNLSYQLGADMTLRSYVNNLFDRYAVNSYFVGTTSQDVLPPRTVGIQLDYKFK